VSAQTTANTERTGHLGAGTWWQGRSGLIVPLIMGAFSTYLLVGILTMEVPADADKPGPQFFPTIIMLVGYALTILLVIAYIRNPEPVDVDDELPAAAEEDKAFSTPVTSAVAASRLSPHEEDEPEGDRQALAAARKADAKHRTHSDFVSLAWGAGGFAAFALHPRIRRLDHRGSSSVLVRGSVDGLEETAVRPHSGTHVLVPGLHRLRCDAGTQPSFGNSGRWLLIWTPSCPSSKGSHTL
jgi:putative tricarboxylic transport membrane protein